MKIVLTDCDTVVSNNDIDLSVLERFQRRRVGGGGREQRRQRPRCKESCREQETRGPPETERDRDTATQRQRETTDPRRAGRERGGGKKGRRRKEERWRRNHNGRERLRTQMGRF